MYSSKRERFLAAIVYVAPTPNHVQIIFQIRLYPNIATRHLCVGVMPNSLIQFAKDLVFLHNPD